MAAMRWTSLVFLPVSWACSYVELPWQANSTVRPSYLIARTMELSNLYGTTEYSIEAVPRGSKHGKFGYVAPMNHFHFDGLPIQVPFEGMNEQGLTVSAHYLAQAVYEAPTDQDEPLSALEVVPRLLANCSCVEDVIKLLESVKVVAPKHGKQSLGGLHWAIADTSGRSIIVEYLEGQRMVYENHPRVMTNDPDIRWHWRNLNTYVNLNPHYPWQNDILQVKTDADIGAVPRPIGHGWNLFGLPGDSSPPSRFVRLFYLRGYALQSRAMTSFQEAVVLGTGLLNNVFLPVGPVAGNPREPGDGPELTDYGVLKSCQEKVMLIRGYVNSQWRKIDLKRLDFSKAHTWPLEDGSLGLQDITDGAKGDAPNHYNMIHTPIILVGNKRDLKEKVVDLREAKEFSRKFHLLPPIECSAKSGEKVGRLFTVIAQEILKTGHDNSLKEKHLPLVSESRTKSSCC